MNYKFALENRNYEDYSSGRVFYNQKGTTSFPVRLASEIYQRCASFLMQQGLSSDYVLYDPCCGGAFLLSTLGYLHGKHISKIYASDIDDAALSLAERNLSLLFLEGLDERIEQIKEMAAKFGKESHSEALQSAFTLRNTLEQRRNAIDVSCFHADITSDTDLIDKVSDVNILITDLPYGEIVDWSDSQNEEEAVKKLLDNVLPVLASQSVVSIVSKKKTKIKHEKYRKVEQFVLGKRQITILQPIYQ